MSFWNHQCKKNADQCQSAEDVEDRVDPETGGQEQAPEQWAADTAQATETRSPGDRSTPHLGREVVCHHPVDQDRRPGGAEADDGDKQQALRQRQVECQQSDAVALNQSGARRFPWGTRLVEELLVGTPIRRNDLFARLASGGLAISDEARLVPVATESPDARMAEAALNRAAATLGGLVYATVDATVYALLGLAQEWISARLTDERVWTSRDLAAEDAIRTIAPHARQELAGLIRPLVDHDAAQSTSLVHTLETHLLTGCSATKSAEALHVSRQTLYQRLERIRTLLGFDPTAAMTYASVLLAISASRVGRRGTLSDPRPGP